MDMFTTTFIIAKDYNEDFILLDYERDHEDDFINRNLFILIDDAGSNYCDDIGFVNLDKLKDVEVGAYAVKCKVILNTLKDPEVIILDFQKF